MVPFDPWSIRDILDFLAEYGGKVIVRNGAPMLDLPKYPCNRWGTAVDREKIAGEVLPHLVARKIELLEWIRTSDPKERAKDIAKAEAARFKANRPERNRIIADICKRIKDIKAKPIWWMCVSPKPEMKKARMGIGDTTPIIPDRAVFLAVEGESEAGWIPLPPVVPTVVPVKRGKRKEWVWNGG